MSHYYYNIKNFVTLKYSLNNNYLIQKAQAYYFLCTILFHYYATIKVKGTNICILPT